MQNQTYGEFSEFEISRIAMKFKEDESYKTAGAVGSCEESMDSRTVTKKYKGMTAKTRTKGTGSGEAKLSWHMDYETYKKAYGMNLGDLEEGVVAYGQNSSHPEFSVVLEVKDEDDNVKFKAYPNCVVKDGLARKTENGSEEVAEIEITIAIMPDEYGNGVYEALKNGVSAEIANKWMTEFTPTLARKKEL